MLIAVDWTSVIESLIASIPAIIAAVAGAIYARNANQTAKKANTSSMANNMILRKGNGAMKSAGTLSEETAQIPLENK